jgi:hypothetical protein
VARDGNQIYAVLCMPFNEWIVTICSILSVSAMPVAHPNTLAAMAAQSFKSMAGAIIMDGAIITVGETSLRDYSE